MIAKYKVKSMCDGDVSETEGYVCGATYADAMDQLAKYFGDDEILTVVLTAPQNDLGMDTVLVTSDRVLKAPNTDNLNPFPIDYSLQGISYAVPCQEGVITTTTLRS